MSALRVKHRYLQPETEVPERSSVSWNHGFSGGSSMTTFRANRDLSLALSAVSLSLVAGQAVGEPRTDQPKADAPSIMSNDPDAGLEAGISPGDIPGVTVGPRTRPTPEPEAPKPEDREWIGGKPWLEWNNMFGDLFGLRTSAADIGLSFNGSLKLDASAVFSGGVRHGRISHRALLDFNMGLDFEKAFGWKGGSVFVDFQSTDVHGGSRDVGDIQGISNLDTGINVHQVAELWLQQVCADGVLRFKVGKIDAATEFGFVNGGKEFVTSAPAWNLSNAYLPTYPNPAVGAVAFVYPTKQWYIGAGFFDGSLATGVQTGRNGPRSLWRGSEFYVIAETGYSWACPAGDGRAAIGVWHNSAPFTTLTGRIERGTTGGYALIDQQLIKRDEAKESDPNGLFMWGHFGIGDDEVSSYKWVATGGLVLKGTFAGRESDQAGVMVSYAGLSDSAGATFKRDEVALEGFYKFAVTPFASVKPFLGYVVNPSGSTTTKDALFGGVRFELTF
jgi:porin